MNLIRRILVIGSAVALAGSLAACGSDTPTAQTTPTPTISAPAMQSPSGPAMATGSAGTLDTCAAADQARVSLGDVRDVNILQEGTDAFKAKVATLRTDVDAAVEAAKADFAPQAEALDQSMDALESSVSGLAASPSVTAVESAGSALRGVTDSFTALTTAMDDAC